MNKIIAIVFVSILIVLSKLTLSFAWDATVTGPNVFGKTKVVAVEGSARESIIVQCETDGVMLLAYIFKKKEFQEINEFPAKLYVQVDKGSPVILEATFRTWNDNYAGVVASDEASILPVLDKIEAGKSKINIGIEILGKQDSASFSVRGSTRTIKKVKAGCDVNNSNS